MYEKMLEERNRLDDAIVSMEYEIARCPEGKLLCEKNGKYVKWYRSDGKNRKIIPKKERKLAEALAAKKYLVARLNEMKAERTAIDYYLRHHDKGTKISEQMISQMPEYQELLRTYFKPIDRKLEEWMNEDYERNWKHPENLIHKTVNGLTVRSKSEAMIARVLYEHKIPFRYECAMTIRETIMYPDFTIIHPQSGKIYYFEHFGMMDNPSYCKNTISKIQLYASNGIIPDIQLLMTFETKDAPLTYERVEALIQYYFS